MANSSKVSVKVDSIKIGTQITWQITTGEIIGSLDCHIPNLCFPKPEGQTSKMLFQKIKHKEAAPGGQTGEEHYLDDIESLLTWKYSVDG